MRDAAAAIRAAGACPSSHPVFLPSLLALSLALCSSASAQTVTVSGSNGQWASTCSTNVMAPSCTGVPATLGDFSQSSWTFTNAKKSGVAIGTNFGAGTTATGTASVTGGATVATDYVYLGYDNNTTGSLTISGSRSNWTAANQLIVGNNGTGTLLIEDGGTFGAAAGSGYFWAGYGASGTGTITVTGVAADGTRSTFASLNQTHIGEAGSGTLNIMAGALATSAFTMTVGELATGVGLVNIDGVDTATGDRSTLQVVNNLLWVGDSGNGTIHITDGGLLDVQNSVDLGADTHASGLITVDGVNQATHLRSTLETDSSTVSSLTSLFIGDVNQGEIDVTHGGLVSTPLEIDLGENTGATGVLKVDGFDPGTGTLSTVTTATQLYVSYFGSGTLSVTNGGVVNVGDIAYIGFQGDGTATVSGNDGNGHPSTLAGSNNLVVAQFATGTLTISDGGMVSNQTGYIGADPNTNGTVTVTGRDSNGVASTWANAAELHVGDAGTGTLNIEAGGLVTVSSTGYVGYISTGQGTVNVSGTDGHGNASTLSIPTDNLVFGQDGAGTLNITGGGLVSNQMGYVGADGIGTATISGSSSDGLVSTWTNASQLIVGDDGTGTLNILAGGMVSDVIGSIGNQVGSGTVLVSGTDGNGHVSTWTSSLQLDIGNGGSGALTVADGGRVISDQGLIANGVGTTGTVTVTGTNGNGHASTWTPANNIYVGFQGNGTLTIADGGVVSTSGAGGGSAAIYIGEYGGSTGTVTVSSSTTDISTLSATGSVLVGEGGDGTLTIAKGGLVHADSYTYVTDSGGSTGTLNLLGDSSGRGVLETYGVVNGDGAGILNLDGGILRALCDQSDFLSGFTALTVGSEGAWFDTNGNSIWVATAFSGSSSINKLGEGWLVLTGDSSGFTGTTTIAAGYLQLGDGGADGMIGGNVTDNGTLMFYRSDIVTFGGTISGSGEFDQFGPGTVILTAANTYTGGTGIKLGVLQIGDGGTAGSIVGDVADDGALAFDRSDAMTLSGVISGAGTVNQIGAGTTTLSGVNSYSGGTIISAGTLSGSATSFGSGAIQDSATLVIDQPANADFANAIDGTGGFVKQGAGRLNYTGTGDLSGHTIVTAGLLSVNGSLANSAVTVQNGGTLGGNGFVGVTTIQNGGAIAPGNSIGALHINGAFVQSAGSVYQVQVDPNSSASDLILVDGAASIANGAGLTVAKYVPGGYRPGTQYTVLTASGGVTGDYVMTGDTAASAYLALQEAQDANNIYLRIIQTGDPTTAAQTPNQTGVANSLPPGGAAQIAVINTPTTAATRSAFDQLSGDALASAKGALVSGSVLVRDTTFDRLRDVLCAPYDVTRDDTQPVRGDCSDQPSLWTQGFGNWGNISGNGNAAGLTQTTGGFLIGADIPVYDWRLGYFGGFSRTAFDVKTRASWGVSDNYHVGAYADTQWGDLGLRLGAAYSWSGIDTDRSVTIGDFSNQLHAFTNAGTIQIFGEVGRRIAFGTITFEPFANLAYINLHTDGFRETGGDAALTAQASTQEDGFATLGVRPSTAISWGSFDATLRGMAGWRHTFGDVTPSSIVSFANSNSFTIEGAPVARDAGVVEAGLDFNLPHSITAGLTYGGQFSSAETDHGIRGTLAIAF